MTEKDYAQTAKELFESGYNCAQAVFCAFCEDYDIDRKTALRLSSSFGGGLGRQREVCGAVSGMCMAAGLIYGESTETDHNVKAEHYKLIQKLCGEFKETNGSIICRELLGITKPDESPVPEQRTAAYYKKRPCAEYVAEAAAILAKELKTHS